MEHRILAESESVLKAILGYTPGLREGGSDLQLLIQFEQALVQLIHHPDRL